MMAATSWSLTGKFSVRLGQVNLSPAACLARRIPLGDRLMRFFSDSSYWIYIIHLPLLFAVQYQLMDQDWSLLAKYTASVGITLAIGAVSYIALVRWTPIGWMLNGRKKTTHKTGALPVAE